MENPKTLETLEVENPLDKTPNEASGSSGMNEIFSGLASVSDICNDFGFENTEVETQVVKDERETGGTVVGDLANHEDEKLEKGCLVNDVCVDDEEKEPKLESTGTLSHNEENEEQAGFLESVVVGNVEDKTRAVTNEEKNDDCGVEDSVKSVNGDEVKESFLVSNGCVDDSEKEVKLDEGNEGVEVKEMAQEEETIEEESLVSNGLPMEMEGPSEGISLYVDITGSPSGLVTEDRKNVDDQGFSFSVGDVVWVRTRNQTWWPGKICDPNDAPKSAERSGREDYLLVGYYGISHFAWCSSLMLKPFHKNFEEAIGKNKARIFLGAVEKAADEFGGLVKSEMTCSCRSKHDQSSANQPLLDGVLNRQLIGEFSATNFEPVAFLERIKNLAGVVSMPCTLDFAVTKNCVSAFYCSTGHKQLPMHLLVEKNDTKGDTESPPEKKIVQGNNRKKSAKEGYVSTRSRKRKPEKDSEPEVEDDRDKAKDTSSGRNKTANKGFDLRERKKSRYLSYPYVNFEQKRLSGACKTEASPNVTSEASSDIIQDVLSPSSSKNNGERFWKKWYSMFTGGSDIPNGSEITKSASAKLLRELRRAAMYGLHSKANKGFSSVGWFFSRFRISVYHDELADEKSPKNAVSQNEVNGTEEASLSGDDVPENKPKQKRVKKGNPIKNSRGDSTVGSPNADGVSESLDVTLEDDDSLSTVKKKKKKEHTARMKTKSLSGLSDVSISVAGIGVSVKDALQIGQSLSPCTNKPKQRKKKNSEEATEPTTGIPDLNGSSCVVSSGDANHANFEGKPEPVKSSDGFKPGNLVVDLQVPRFGSLDKDGHKASESSGTSVSKKRKRKEKNVVQPEHIPDLNRSMSGESNLAGKETQEANGTATNKRKRKKQTQVVLNYPRNPSFVGTTLLLTFAAGALTPSKEDLVSKFSKFGELMESDTKVFEHPGSAQIVFAKIEDAREALRSAEKDKPFGASVVKLRLHQGLGGAAASSEDQAQAGGSGQPPLEFIKQNLEMMTAMLEKSGDKLSQEMRAKLEAEIKGLLSKVSSMAGSCS